MGTWIQDSGNDTRVQGIPDQLMNNVADICITEAYITARRAVYLKFLHPTYAES